MTVQRSIPPLPIHDPIGVGRQCFEACCIITAVTLLAVLGFRLGTANWANSWVWPFFLIGGALIADFVSGVVHWTADTWGSESMPLVGRRFVRPFRVHHINPDDFLRRRFLDTNGDVAMLTIPFLVVAHALPLQTFPGQAAATFLTAFSFVVMPTNQVHQWAHQSHPPGLVRWMQDHNVILSRREHGRHHRAPFARNYCIATGWCNGFLERVQFFRRIERVVTAVIGCRPREDEATFQQSMESRFASTDAETTGG